MLPTALLLVSSLAGASSFQAQVATYARTRSLSVDWVSNAQLDEDAAREHLARLCNPREPASAVYVLEQEPGVLWSLDAPADEQLPCPSKPPAARPLPTRLKLSRQETPGLPSRSLAFREGRPVFVASSQDSRTQHGNGSVTDETDWDSLLFRSTMTISGTDSGTDVLEGQQEEDFASSPSWLTSSSSKGTSSTFRVEGALVPVLASAEAAATLPPTLNHVISGREQWSGAKDASVRVVALAQGTEHVRLRIQVLDELPVPAPEAPSDPELLDVDHLELRWGYAPRHQLVVARTGKGVPLVRWLQQPPGANEPPPTVALEGDTFLVDLPLSLLRARQRTDSWQVPFSVVFSDSDAPGTGARTRVALSTQEGHRTPIARLVSFPGSTRYPPMSDTSFGLPTLLAPATVPKP